MKVSNAPQSCTQDVEVGAEFRVNGRPVRLIDTPGFDDTDRGEVEILRLIATFMAEA
jgi:predicted GTPase